MRASRSSIRPILANLRAHGRGVAALSAVECVSASGRAVLLRIGNEETNMCQFCRLSDRSREREKGNASSGRQGLALIFPIGKREDGMGAGPLDVLRSTRQSMSSELLAASCRGGAGNGSFLVTRGHSTEAGSTLAPRGARHLFPCPDLCSGKTANTTGNSFNRTSSLCRRALRLN